MSNKNVYKKKRIVNIYSSHTELQKPEETILNILKNDLSEMRMLDIGVGGGRTTLHFAKLVKKYVGIDYSEEMIEACRRRFDGYPADIAFQVCDARNLDIFKDNSFDFVLFSFNGIDYVSNKERLAILGEIKRILNPGGFFCFSTHNLQSIHKLFDFRRQLCLNVDLLKKIIRWFLIRFIYNKNINVKNLKSAEFAVFNDGAERFGLQTYYIDPLRQIEQLQPYFKSVRTFLLKSGSEIDKTALSNSSSEDWIYYLCNK